MDKAALTAIRCLTPWQSVVAEKRKLSFNVTRNGCCVLVADSRLYVSLKSVKFKLEWRPVFIHELINSVLCKVVQFSVLHSFNVNNYWDTAKQNKTVKNVTYLKPSESSVMLHFSRGCTFVQSRF